MATNIVVHVCDDPERGWNEVKEHYFYVRQVYQQWFAEAGDLTQVDDSVRVADDLPRGAYVVGTPEMVIEAIERRREGRDFDRLIFWARPPGIDIETSSRLLELMATKVLPHFAAESRERPSVKLANGLGDLAYSTLVHPADDWDELWASVQEYLPKVKQRVSPDAPSAVSLRLSAATVERLLADQSALADLRAFLAAEDLYVITANAFPYGPFKNRLVMETVFEPDWRDRRRAEYTKGVATILSAIATDGVSPTIQTAPLGFKPHVTPGVVERFTEHVLQVVAHLVELARTTGTTVRLGLEPEPFCHVETTEEAIRYFGEELFTDAAAARLATLAGIDDARPQRPPARPPRRRLRHLSPGRRVRRRRRQPRRRSSTPASRSSSCRWRRRCASRRSPPRSSTNSASSPRPCTSARRWNAAATGRSAASSTSATH